MLKYLVCAFVMLSFPLVSEAGCGGTSGGARRILSRVFRPFKAAAEVRAQRAAFTAPVAFVAPTTSTVTKTVTTTSAASSTFVPPPVAGVRVVPTARYFAPAVPLRSSCPSGNCPFAR